MFSNVFIGGSPSRDGRESHTLASPHPQRPPSHSPEILRVESDIQHPSAQNGLTSGSPHPNRAQSPKSTQAPTSDRSRIEVVLNVSPFKQAPGHARFYDAHDLEDEPVISRARPKKGRPRKAAPSVPVTSAASLPKGKRPRGRPKGWRPGMPSLKTGLLTASAYKYRDKDGKIKVTAASVPKSTGPKRRGRPPRQPSPTPRGVWEKLVAPPQYVPFLCEWPACKAELQNIETLRRHIRIVHGRAEPLMCWWPGCEGRSPIFTQDYDFHHHVDQKHLVPFMWHVGDGQKNEKLMAKQEEDADQVPAYLFGADGKQVTPSVKNQEIEDFVSWRGNRERLKNMLLQRDANAPFEDEDEDGDEAEDDEQALSD